MPENTPDHDIPYPSPSDPIRGSTGDYILTDLRDLALGTDSAITSAVGTRAPLSHTHTQSQIGGLPSALASAGETAQWGSVSGKPSAYPPSAHTHPVSDVDGLGARLAKLEYASGVRNVTSLATGITSGTILFQVSSGVAQMILAAAEFATGSPTPFASGGPLSEWAPTTPGIDVRGWALDESTGLTYRFEAARSGAVYLRGTPANTRLQGVVMWPFNRPVPTSPIGDPA